MFGIPACVVPYADAGEACTDSSECEGRCLVDLTNTDANPAVGSSATGICEADTDPCGCWYEVLDGTTQQGLCAD